MQRPADALVDAEQILLNADSRMASVQSLSVYARVWQGDLMLAVPVRMDVVAKRPSKLFFALLDPTQNMLGALASDGTRFTSFQRGQSDCLTGPACASNVGRFIQLALEPSAIVSILMGGAPTIAAVSRQVEWDERAGAYCVTLTDARGQRQRVWVTHAWLTRRTKVFSKDGALLLDVAFADERKVDGHLIAHQIDLLVPKSKARSVRIIYREVDLDDEDLSDQSFQLQCPKGAQLRHLPCPETRRPTPGPKAPAPPSAGTP